jgi:hypothetical protein
MLIYEQIVYGISKDGKHNVTSLRCNTVIMSYSNEKKFKNVYYLINMEKFDCTVFIKVCRIHFYMSL